MAITLPFVDPPKSSPGSPGLSFLRCGRDPRFLVRAKLVTVQPGARHKDPRIAVTTGLDAAEVRVGIAPDELCDTTLVCGFLGCDLRPFNPLIATLPRLMHLRAQGGQDWIGQFMLQAVAESKTKRPGGEAMLERMSEMMFIDAVRRYVESLPQDSRGWLAGLRDRFVGQSRVVAANPEGLQQPDMRQQLGIVQREAQEHPRVEPIDRERLRVPRVGGERGGDRDEPEQDEAQPLQYTFHVGAGGALLSEA